MAAAIPIPRPCRAIASNRRAIACERITPQNNGSWKAETTRDAVPTRPQGVPSKVTIFPDGRVLEEREPLSVNPPRP